MITISNHRLVFEYKMSFFSGDGKTEFQLPLLQSSVSHDSSEIPPKNISYYYQCWKDSLTNRKFKRTAFIWNRDIL